MPCSGSCCPVPAWVRTLPPHSCTGRARRPGDSGAQGRRGGLHARRSCCSRDWAGSGAIEEASHRSGNALLCPAPRPAHLLELRALAALLLALNLRAVVLEQLRGLLGRALPRFLRRGGRGTRRLGSEGRRAAGLPTAGGPRELATHNARRRSPAFQAAYRPSNLPERSLCWPARQSRRTPCCPPSPRRRSLRRGGRAVYQCPGPIRAACSVCPPVLSTSTERSSTAWPGAST